MILSEFDQIMKEYFDMSDRNTRRYIIGLDEAGNDELLAALSEKLYDNIISKVGEIDFGTIPKSRGDITKVEKFDMTLESLDIIRRLVLEYKENTDQVDVILSAIENIKDNKGLFMKGYALNVELPIVIYNLMTLSVVRSTSLIIATCINYVADPATKSMKMAFDKSAYKDTESDVLFQQLVTFNEMCKNGSLVKLLNGVITNNKTKAYREDIEYSDINTVPNGFDSNIPAENIPTTVDNQRQYVDNIVGDTAPNNAEVPLMATPPQNQLPKDEDGVPVNIPVSQANNIPNDDDIIAGDSNVAPTTDVQVQQVPNNVPAQVPPTPDINNPNVQPIIPENRMATTGTVRPALNMSSESVEKNIETDFTFEKELAGAKESPVDDKDDSELRSGSVKYASDQKEAIKQKILGAAHENAIKNFIKDKIITAYENASEGPIEDKDDADLRAGKEKYASDQKEAIKQKILGAAIESVNTNIETDTTFDKELKGAKESPIDDKCDTGLRAGELKYDSNKVEGKNQEPIEKALESNINEANIGKIINKMPIGAKVAVGVGVLMAALAGINMLSTGFIKVVIPWLRSLTYTIFYTQMKISDYFQIQAELIESNANEIESTTADDDNKKKRVIQNQRKWADRFRKWSNMFNIDRTNSEKKVREEISKDEKNKSKIGKNDTGDDVLF